MSRVVIFAFWGRQENVELQLPFIQRILAENPDAEFHGWDLCRDRQDSRFLRTIKGDRIQVKTQFYSNDGRASRGQVKVWNHYTDPSYQNTVFVKLDDDDVFLETEGFRAFIEAAQNNPGHVISGLTVNNGASTRHIPDLWEGMQTLPSPDENEAAQGKPMELLDAHLSVEFADMCHRWFHTNWETLTQGEGTVPTEDWVSINAIAMSWPVLHCISSLIGRVPPTEIAGRFFTPRNRIGDEGAANMLPRLICKDFVVGHLNFGPQLRQMDDAVLTELRKLYTDISSQYLEVPVAA
ncbi:hypothetical protein [Mycolicibacterium austroafricanum]|uniref:hypothetical protein n=1 Tax=Mycolicibacterium austroafricanum TaxID=39687 RepID=UPI001CA30831|nr:hypothetical protein [Mycolicibacterium austroafricanum]QZT61258.1 hypothetical protein JN085_20030 [Mycolicibacterium austroafricanum]